MKQEPTLSPAPRSSTPGSFSFGVVVTLLVFLGIGKAPIYSAFPADRSAPKTPPPSASLAWKPIPLLPENFDRNQFVEANPQASENPPDETSNFSFKDQQAAQPKPNTDLPKAQAPEVLGEKQTSKIVPAENPEPSPPEPPAETVPPTKPTPSEDSAIPNQATILPASDVELEEGPSDDGSRTRKSETKAKESLALNRHQQQEPDASSPAQLSPGPAKPYPQARPKLSPELIRGPLTKTFTTAPRIGTVAIECRLHPYGVYLQQMLKSIEEQWHQLAAGSTSFLQKDRLPGLITIRFTLLSTGRIEKLSRLDSEGPSLPAELCRQAVQSRVPFGKWTDDMIKDFGKSDEVTISFRYR